MALLQMGFDQGRAGSSLFRSARLGFCLGDKTFISAAVLASSAFLIYYLSMTPTQCKMARIGLAWRAKDLAEAAGVGTATVARFELGEPVANETRDKLQEALADAGAQFSRRSGRVGVTVPE